MAKICCKCKIEKEEICFHKNNSSKTGLQSRCKVCSVAIDKKYKADNKEKTKSNYKKWQRDNLDKFREGSAEYRKKNPEKVKKSLKSWYLKNKEKVSLDKRQKYLTNRKQVIEDRKQYAKQNPGKINALCAKRHAKKLKAKPKWLSKFDLDYIKSLYIQAKELEKLDGIERHVDHIVPLQGKDVSGLHVPWNLQILTAEENLIKHNKVL